MDIREGKMDTYNKIETQRLLIRDVETDDEIPFDTPVAFAVKAQVYTRS